MFCVYQITNEINGKIYIGRHACSDRCSHKRNGVCLYMGSGIILKEAKQKYGIENFSKKILHVFDNADEMNAKEFELVDAEFVAREDTYNLCPGGRGPGKGKIVTQETRERMSAAFKGRMYSEKTRSRMSSSAKIRQTGETNSFHGKKHRTETLEQMSNRQKEISPARGSSWWNNGEKNLKIQKGNSAPDGYVRGRIIPWNSTRS